MVSKVCCGSGYTWVQYCMFSNCSIVDPDTWVQYCMFSNLSVVDPDTWVQYCMLSNCSIVDLDTPGPNYYYNLDPTTNFLTFKENFFFNRKCLCFFLSLYI